MPTKTFSSLPRVAQFEVAQFLSHPVLAGFLQSAAKELYNVDEELVIPMVADAAKCQQFVSELQANRAKAQVLLELLELGQTNFDTQTLETER